MRLQRSKVSPTAAATAAGRTQRRSVTSPQLPSFDQPIELLDRLCGSGGSGAPAPGIKRKREEHVKGMTAGHDDVLPKVREANTALCVPLAGGPSEGGSVVFPQRHLAPQAGPSPTCLPKSERAASARRNRTQTATTRIGRAVGAHAKRGVGANAHQAHWLREKRPRDGFAGRD